MSYFLRRPALARVVFLIALVVAISLANLGPTIHNASGAGSQLYDHLNLFGVVLEKVRANYVDKPDDTKLIENAINGMVQGLDPHSSYLTPKQYQDAQVETRGEFGGLGLDVTMEDGFLKVVAPIDNTPASHAGVVAGDVITDIDGKAVRGLSMDEAIDRMRGPAGSPITLTIARPAAKDPLSIKMVREVIKVNPVQASAEGDVAWIKLKTFESEQTFDYLKQAVDDMKAHIGSSIKGYVLDLRNNPGELLDEAVAVSDAFLERGVIVVVKGRTVSDIERIDAKPGDITGGKPLVVLVNGGSASASEIVAGALQDYGRATLIGTRSFGKGSVQTMIPLGANGALRITTARYYTPSGRSIQATGIEPDYTVQPELPYDMKPQLALIEGEAALPGHLKNSGAQEKHGSSAYVPKDKEQDNQLKAAIDFLHGKIPGAVAPVEQVRAMPVAATPKAADSHGG